MGCCKGDVISVYNSFGISEVAVFVYVNKHKSLICAVYNCGKTNRYGKVAVHLLLDCTLYEGYVVNQYGVTHVTLAEHSLVVEEAESGCYVTQAQGVGLQNSLVSDNLKNYVSGRVANLKLIVEAQDCKECTHIRDSLVVFVVTCEACNYLIASGLCLCCGICYRYTLGKSAGNCNIVGVAVIFDGYVAHCNSAHIVFSRLDFPLE